MSRGHVCVFIGYSETTTKQFRVYTLDLRYTTRSSIVDWDEGTLGGTVDLKIQGPRPQGTPNELLLRNPARRPRLKEVEEEESIPIVALPLPEKLNNFDIIIPLLRPNKIPTLQPVTTQPSVLEPDQGNPNPPDQASSRPDEPVPQCTDILRTDQAVKDSQTPANTQPPAYNLQKQRANPSDTLEERQAKIVKAILAIAQTIDIGPEEVALLALVGVETIPVPKTYKEAISDPQYGSQ
jgi:hypothetical protein